MKKVYRQACQWHQWWLVRYCATKLRKTITSLAPSITRSFLTNLNFKYKNFSLLVRGKQVISAFILLY